METGLLAEKLVSWIRERVDEARCQGAVFGMSGGIDSAVVAALCKGAFPDAILGVLMPCHSSPEDKEHALLVTDKFAIPTKEVVLDGVYDSLAGALPDFEAESRTGLPAQGNVKARLRITFAAEPL